MNNIRSENVQGVMTLYLSRKLRFDDVFFEQYKQSFNIDGNVDMKILKIKTYYRRQRKIFLLYHNRQRHYNLSATGIPSS